jgi:hypothetical protein
VPGHRPDGWRRWWLPTWCGLLTALIWAPLVRPGFVLTYDMVTVPDQRLVPEALGLGSGLPRAVPQDAVLAILTGIVPGQFVYRLILIGVVFGAALGAGRVLDGSGLGAQTVAASAYAWNAYVAERLVIGHWTLLVAYAAMPWIVRAASLARNGDRRALPLVIVLVGLSSLTPSGGLLAAGLAGAVWAGRARWIVIAAGLAMQLPWVMPAMLNQDALSPDPNGVDAFAARSDSPIGLVGSVLTLGGIWNGDVVPDSRSLISATLLTVAWIILAVLGARDLRARFGAGLALALTVLAAVGVVLALAGAWGGALAWAVENLPGAGLLRDGQKFLVWYAVLLAPAAGLGAGRVGTYVAKRARHRAAVAVVGVAGVLPLLALPDLAWGAWGRLEPVQYPSDWRGARDALQERVNGEALIVLPFQPFRSFPWNDHRTVLDPFPRFAGVEAVMPDALTVGDRRIAGEDPRAARVDEVLEAESPVEGLRDAGVGWVAVEHDTPGELDRDLLAQLQLVYKSTSIAVYRVPGDVAHWAGGAPRGPVIVADAFTVLLLAASGLWLVVVRTKLGRSGEPGTVPAK